MTPDERLEALLNRAGQTISDLPKKGMEVSEPYPLIALPKANGAAWNWYLDICTDMDDYDSTRSKMILKLYILHLTDVIDRMETALENVCGERDYLAKLIGKSEKLTCAACAYNEVPLAHDPCLHCSFGIVEALKFARVPEDWRVDDD